MEIIVIIMISILVILLLLAFIILPNNYLYNTIFNRKDRKTLEFLIRNTDKFDYIGTHKIGKAFRWGDYLAIIWFDNTCSIYVNTNARTKCLSAHCDKVMSNKMRDLLLAKMK